MLIRTRSSLLVALTVVLSFTLGCDSRAPVQLDTLGPSTDGSVWPDGWAGDTVPPKRDLGIAGRDFVVSRIILPTAFTAPEVGVDYNGDGIIDNALGMVLGALSGVSSDVDLQSSLDNAVNSGASLMLLRLIAADYANAPSASAWTWVGQSQACCTSPHDPPLCAQQALKGCFAGGHPFRPVTGSGSELSGHIKDGKLFFGPAAMRFKFAPTTVGSLDLTLKQAYIRGDYHGGVIEGVFAGVVRKSEFDATLLPAVAGMLSSVLVDPAADQATKETIRTLFDENGDDQITADEVAGNALIKTFLSGDVDVDQDGELELSLGLGFKAVPAKILQ